VSGNTSAKTNEASPFTKDGSFTISGALLVRNMVAAGIPDVLCMKISGHKSRSVFDRYNVVSTSDVAEATQKLENRKLQVKMELAPKLAPAIQKQNRRSLKTA